MSASACIYYFKCCLKKRNKHVASVLCHHLDAQFSTIAKASLVYIKGGNMFCMHGLSVSFPLLIPEDFIKNRAP